MLSPAGSSSAAAQARSASAAALRTNDSQPSPRKKQSSKGHRGEGESGSKTSKTVSIDRRLGGILKLHVHGISSCQISAGDQGSAKPQKKTKGMYVYIYRGQQVYICAHQLDMVYMMLNIDEVYMQYTYMYI